jgi:hypothetical protein
MIPWIQRSQRNETYKFLAGLLDGLVGDLPLGLVNRVGPGGLEGLALDPRLLDGVIQRVG